MSVHVPSVTFRIPPRRYLCGLVDCFYGDPTLQCLGSKRQLRLHVHFMHLSQVPCLPGTSSKLGEEAISQRGNGFSPQNPKSLLLGAEGLHTTSLFFHRHSGNHWIFSVMKAEEQTFFCFSLDNLQILFLLRSSLTAS